jgi:hypothetical protein
MSDNDNLKEFIKRAHEEVTAEAESQMSAEDKALYMVSKKLLLLERDLKASGVSQTADMRVTRLLEIIEKEQF